MSQIYHKDTRGGGGQIQFVVNTFDTGTQEDCSEYIHVILNKANPSLLNF